MSLHLTQFTSLFNSSRHFLGDWCDPTANIRYLPHRYDNHGVQQSDYLLVNKLYHHLLHILHSYSSCFNPQLCLSKRGIEILYGPWLKSFLICFVDRYYTIFSSSTHSFLVASYDTDFNVYFQSSYSSCASFNTDPANQHIFQTIIKFLRLKTLPVLTVLPCLNDNLLVSEGSISSKLVQPNPLLIFLFSCYTFLSSFFSRLNLYRSFIAYSYLPLLSNIILSLRYYSFYFPSFFHISLSTSVRDSYSSRLRNQLSLYLKSHLSLDPSLNINSDCFIQLLIDFLPGNLLESLPLFFAKAKQMHWPISGKSMHILTANCYQYNDFFCFVTAMSVSTSTSKLSIIQHGGNYGNALFNSSEDHQRSISDAYWTWGWKEDIKTYPVGVCKQFPKYKPPSVANLKIMYVLMELNRYVYINYGGIHSSQWIDYCNLHLETISTLKSKSYDIVLRIKPRSNCWDSQSRFSTLNLPFDRTPSFHSSVCNFSLIISTYNAATYLETMAMNVPTIIYWNPLMWPLRDSALPYFKLLTDCNVLIKTPSKLVSVLSDIESKGVFCWWNEPHRRESIFQFIAQYAQVNPNYACSAPLHY